MSEKRIPQLVIEGARVLFTNFKGEARQYNNEGDRNFCVVIDDAQQAQDLREDGWNVRILRPRDEGDQPINYLQVNINYAGRRPPVVFMVTGHNKAPLSEETIGELDNMDIQYVDVVINPYRWNVRGDTGISGYLSEMYAVVNEARFAHKYEQGQEELPF